MRHWSGVAAAYRTSFATLCAGTEERLLAETTGPRLLDAGSGTGHLAALAAAAGRSVTAVDADPDMVAMTSAALPGRALHASLPALPFPDDTFDAVTANFVVNHVADPRATVHELGRVTRPGGRLGLTIWPAGAAGWGTLVSEAFDAASVCPVPGERLAPELDFERSVAGLQALTQDAGLETIAAGELGWTWEIHADALWAGIAAGVANVGRTFLGQSSAIRTAASHEFRRLAHEQSVAGVLRLPATAAYVVAAG